MAKKSTKKTQQHTSANKSSLDRIKMQAASEVGVHLKNGYNGDLTSRQAGMVGGQMVKRMIEAYNNLSK